MRAMRMGSMASGPDCEEEPGEVRAAFDPNYNPARYEPPMEPDEQQVEGVGFGDLRDEMNTRRSRTARRMRRGSGHDYW